MINIRLACNEDIPVLNELIKHSGRELSQDVYNEYEIDSAIQYVFGIDTQLIDDQTYYVIEQEGQIAGCGGWSKRDHLFGGDQFFKTKAIKLLDPSKDSAKIRAFFIHPNYARQGLGSALLKHCEAQAQAAGFTQFEMMATLAGVRLYEKFQYRSLVKEDILLPNNRSLKFVRMQKNTANLDLKSTHFLL